MSKFNVGDKVRYIGKEHEEMPEYYPKVGTIGTIKDVRELNAWIKWPNGSTSKSDCWRCSLNDIERIVEEITNEEIWEMLKPKMEKNNVLSELGVLCQGEDKLNKLLDTSIIDGKYVTDVYPAKTVQYAIAIAYRSGYERAMKGRPFKFGEKKKGGHWEPIDPNNLPKEGTEVRYSREYKGYADSDRYICINDTGIIKLEGSWFGVTLDNPNRYKWICFDNAEDCLDMWVEDDE